MDSATMRAQIVGLLKQARLLLDAARHHTTREQIRFATRDLDEALAFLLRVDLNKRPLFVTIVNSNLHSATARLRVVADALTKDGADANVMD